MTREEAIKELRGFIGQLTEGCQEAIKVLIPELKESEDERIKRAIKKALQIRCCDYTFGLGHRIISDESVTLEEAIAWLEKQKEQKPANKPKFKVGDWIIFAENHNSVYQVERIDKYRYYLRHYLGGTLSAHFDNELVRQWTIQDAKPGDVLVCIGKYGQEIGIVKEYVGKYGGCDKCFETYCFVDWEGIFRTGEYMGSKEIHPATKEQRNTLMKAMADNGYTFDFENKKLNKKEQKLNPSNSVGLEQKPAEWSEEDEENLNMVLDMVKYCSVVPPEDVPSSTGHLRPSEKYKKELMDWLKSLSPQLHKETYQAAKHDLAIKFMNYLDENRPEGKMCLSNEECEDIDKAFEENDWAKIIRWCVWKYQIQLGQKTEAKLTGWVARDGNGEIYVYSDYPDRISEQQLWIGDNSMPLDEKSFPGLKGETEPVEVEVTITRKSS